MIDIECDEREEIPGCVSDGRRPALAVDRTANEGNFSFGRRLRRARMRHDWSQVSLAHRMGEAAAKRGRTAAGLSSLVIMLSKWENGHKVPNQFNRHLLATVLEVAVEDLGLTVDPDFVWPSPASDAPRRPRR